MKASRAVLGIALASSAACAAFFGALALAGAPGRAPVTIRSEPSGASVFVDGSFRGVTPLEIADLAPGGHSLRIEKAGFEALFGVLGGASPGAVDFRLVPVDTGTLEVRSEPPSAEVFVDGVFRGVTPLALEDLRAGAHVVRVEKTNHDPRAVSVLVPAGERAVAHLELEDRVLRYLEHAAKEDPDDMLTHMELGHYLMIGGDPDRAAPVYCRAMVLARRPDTNKNDRRKLEMTVKHDRGRGGTLGARLGAELDRLLREHDARGKR